MRKIICFLLFILISNNLKCQFIFDDSCYYCFHKSVYVLKQKEKKLVFNNDKSNYIPLGEKSKDLYHVEVDSCKKNNEGKYEIYLKIFENYDIFGNIDTSSTSEKIFDVYIMKRKKNRFKIINTYRIKFYQIIRLIVDFDNNEYVGVKFTKSKILTFGKLHCL